MAVPDFSKATAAAASKAVATSCTRRTVGSRPMDRGGHQTASASASTSAHAAQRAPRCSTDASSQWSRHGKPRSVPASLASGRSHPDASHAAAMATSPAPVHAAAAGRPCFDITRFMGGDAGGGCLSHP
ncbi:hypothetical protein HK414_17730 [Ramlibacter terrae]|uniref:Uncharacterized protein n=1 Tax=Ramlibacter terrae TaxID=2732511 RepID=A0ABX6P448_9BURK|nr:hypothetical protein HK414_17730 [Ramlibacter terrae]